MNEKPADQLKRAYMAGKGDTRRPAAVSEEELQRRWEETFGSKRETLEAS